MKIYRKVIPKIAKDVVRTLLANRAIEVEDGHRDEAELDIAGVIVTYQNAVDKLAADAQDAVQRHGMSLDAVVRIKRSLADTRKIIIGDGALEYVIDQVIEELFNSKHVLEVFAEDNELRQLVHSTVRKYVGVDEELDREVRGRLKNLREGTSEWETEYNRLIDQMRHHKTA